MTEPRDDASDPSPSLSGRRPWTVPAVVAACLLAAVGVWLAAPASLSPNGQRSLQALAELIIGFLFAALWVGLILRARRRRAGPPPSQ